MTFTQLIEQVRLELQRRIRRGSMSVSLLARKAGLGPSHVSNFLHRRRGLKPETLDRILSAMGLEVEDLLQEQRGRKPANAQTWDDLLRVPLVSHDVAVHAKYIQPKLLRQTVPFSAEMVQELESKCPAARRAWERLVVVRMEAEDALGMEPVLHPGALLLLDRHYTSLSSYQPGRRSLYAVQVEGRLTVRYAEFVEARLVLRPLQAGSALQVIAVGSREAAREMVVGRVVAVIVMEQGIESGV